MMLLRTKMKSSRGRWSINGTCVCMFKLNPCLVSVCWFNWIKTWFKQRLTAGVTNKQILSLKTDETFWSRWPSVCLMSGRVQSLIPAMNRQLLWINTRVNSYHRCRGPTSWSEMYFVSRSIFGSCLFEEKCLWLKMNLSLCMTLLWSDQNTFLSQKYYRFLEKVMQETFRRWRHRQLGAESFSFFLL